MIYHTGMPDANENKERVTITLDADLLRRIDGVCEARGEPRSAFIERMLRREIHGEEELMADLESPLYRAVVHVVKGMPGFVDLVAKAAGQDAAEVREAMNTQLARGKERQAGKRMNTKRTAEPKDGS